MYAIIIKKFIDNQDNGMTISVSKSKEIVQRTILESYYQSLTTILEKETNKVLRAEYNGESDESESIIQWKDESEHCLTYVWWMAEVCDIDSL